MKIFLLLMMMWQCGAPPKPNAVTVTDQSATNLALVESTCDTMTLLSFYIPPHGYTGIEAIQRNNSTPPYTTDLPLTRYTPPRENEEARIIRNNLQDQLRPIFGKYIAIIGQIFQSIQETPGAMLSLQNAIKERDDTYQQLRASKKSWNWTTMNAAQSKVDDALNKMKKILDNLNIDLLNRTTQEIAALNQAIIAAGYNALFVQTETQAANLQRFIQEANMLYIEILPQVTAIQETEKAIKEHKKTKDCNRGTGSRYDYRNIEGR